MTHAAWAQRLKGLRAARDIIWPMPRTLIAVLLSFALAAPSPAAAAALAAPRRAAAGARTLPRLGAPGLLRPSLSPLSLRRGLPAASAARAGVPVSALRASAAARSVLLTPSPAVAAARATAPAREPAVELRAPAETEALPAAARGFAAPLAARERSAPAPEFERGAWEPLWTGAARREPAGEPAVPAGPSHTAARTGLFRARRLLLPAAAGAGAVAAPAPAAAASAAAGPWTSLALPAFKLGGVGVAAYAGARAARWGIGRAGRRLGWSAQTMMALRFVSTGVIWTGAVAYSLSALGVSDTVLFATFGASGAAMALAVRELVGNVVHGVHFFFSQPFVVGDRVVIDDMPGTVQDLTLTYLLVRTEAEPPYAYYTYSKLMSKAVVIEGSYESRRERLKLRRAARPRGLLRALRDVASPRLWRPALFSLLGAAALWFLPEAAAWLAAKAGLPWTAALVPYAKAALTLFLAHSLAQAATRSLSRLTERYGWSAQAGALGRLAARTLVWAVAATFALNALGVSWGALAASVSLGSIVLGIAVSDYFLSIVHGGRIIWLKPFQVDDHVAIGKEDTKIQGRVLDVTLQHVVLASGADAPSHILVPNATVEGVRTPRGSLR